MKYFITPTAIRQYCSIAGLADSAPHAELSALLEAAHEVSPPPMEQYTVMRTGRVMVGRRKTRLDIIVSHTPRMEGELPQVITVRDKGSGNRSTRGRGKPVIRGP